MLSNYRMIWQQMEGQRLRYGSAILALLGAAIFLYLVPLVPQIVLDGVISRNPDDATGFTRRVVDGLGGRDFLHDRLWIAGFALLALTAVAGGFTYLRGRWSAMAAEAIACKVRDRLYDHLHHLPVGFHDDAKTGDLVQRCTSDVETLRAFLATQVVEIGRAACMFVLPIPLMLALDVRMTLISVAIVPPIVIFSLIFFKRVRARFKLADEAEGRLTATLQENLTGIRVVRAFARQEFEEEKFGERNVTYRDLDNDLYRLMAWYWSLSDLMCMAQKALVIAVGGYWLAVGELPVGTFYFFLAAVNLFIWPMRMMGRILTELGKATVAIGRIGEILNAAEETQPEDTARIPERFEGRVAFERVTFAHTPDANVLEDVDFEVEPGQTLALLGPSGAGKSTIVNLLLRLYDPDQGRITIDGIDTTSLHRKAVRSQIAVVLQEPFLYSKTIKENIRVGRSNAADPEIMQAATVACVHDNILEFDDKYDTVVGERGVTLSGGQRQRVALARALLDRPAILVLDDALSAVDTDTESLILSALRQRRGRETTIVIAHRLSTVMHADRILVLDAGHVVQQGTHESLLREEGMYRRLWTIQSAVEEQLDDDLRTATGAAGA